MFYDQFRALLPVIILLIPNKTLTLGAKTGGHLMCYSEQIFYIQ